ncbi:cytochrome P450 [Kitasatospora sp. MAP12-15]|uniref:cytochrome P450 n=1 Tax=unclassified Kitasatospora TaxID=2633591 RepID=UPI0024768E81|nr:cytochrome P450 [Kitasatospora sp. MAP12-44]MDH6114214.1 cytochrome P450 [Kitasatospora sp. MAP12-44]
MTETRPDTLTLPVSRGGCPFDPPALYRQDVGASRVNLWDGTSCWLLTGYREVRTALTDHRFSADARHPNFPFLTPGRRALVGNNPSFIRLDDPEHSRLRRMLTGDFLIKRVEAMRPGIQRIVDEALDAMVAHGSPADLVAEFALPVPSLVICELLGVPYRDHGFFQRQSQLLLDNTTSAEAAKEAADALTDYLTEQADRAASSDGDSEGILGRLAARGDLTSAEIAANGVLLLIAGHETTANMTSLSTLALLRNPAQADRLRADSSLIRGAVEELLRYLTIVHNGLPRVALEDVELADGQLILAGEGVLCQLATANRDEELFPAGSELRVERDARRHLAFGFGVHQCLGQPLARAELQIVLETLLRRLPQLRLAVPFEELKFREEALVYGLKELPVAW